MNIDVSVERLAKLTKLKGTLASFQSFQWKVTQAIYIQHQIHPRAEDILYITTYFHMSVRPVSQAMTSEPTPSTEWRSWDLVERSEG